MRNLLWDALLYAVYTDWAKANSIEPFYRGDIAQSIADGFSKNGGLVTKEDLAAYRARLVEPLRLSWGGHTIHTPPLGCGGITVLQMLAILKALKWDAFPDGRERLVLRVEAMRLAWRDRLTLLGDPDFSEVPQAKLLSDDYAAECAEKIRAAVKTGQILEPDFKTSTQGGTLNFSACDKHGNIAALTLTHGDGFGAHVTVDGLGLTLGHGMSRFDPRPDHPNAPGPRKRPLHNMAPVLITKGSQPVVAIGGRGGRRIPNAMLEFLTQHVVRGRPFGESLASPRLHTEGGKLVEHQKAWPKPSIDALNKAGYTVKTGGSATLSGVALARANGPMKVSSLSNSGECTVRKKPRDSSCSLPRMSSSVDTGKSRMRRSIATSHSCCLVRSAMKRETGGTMRSMVCLLMAP